jgi:GNAT superfamily N-acetyltransferase
MNATHQIIRTRTLSAEECAAVDQLWNEEYPIKLSNRFSLLLQDVSNYEHFLLKAEDGSVIGWAVYFEKDGEIRFSIIVGARFQGKGYGKLLLDCLKSSLDEFYGWVIDHGNDIKANGAYITPMPFYEKNGFEILSGERIDSEMISAVKIRWRRPKAQ